MIDVDIMEEQIKLGKLYEIRWGKEIDFVGMPPVLTQHKLLLVMRFIVDTGDSVLVGYKKIKGLIEPYCNYLMTVTNIENMDVVDEKCHLCGGQVRMYQTGNSYEYKCDTRNCISIVNRGI